MMQHTPVAAVMSAERGFCPETAIVLPPLTSFRLFMVAHACSSLFTFNRLAALMIEECLTGSNICIATLILKVNAPDKEANGCRMVQGYGLSLLLLMIMAEQAHEPFTVAQQRARAASSSSK